MCSIRVKLLVLLILFIPTASWGACSGGPTSWTSASADQTDVQDCLNEASWGSGDTLTIPIDAASTWSSRININADTITIQGSGTQQTIIGQSGGFDINGHNSVTTLNLKFSNTSTSIYSDSNITGLVVGNSYFDGHTGYAIALTGGASGVIYNNRFDIDGGDASIEAYGQDATEWGHSADFGGNSFQLFIEDNLFYQSTYSAAAHQHGITIREGMGMVVRCNYFDNVSSQGGDVIDTHGYGHGTNHSGRSWEVYGNYFTRMGYSRVIHMRGGTGLIFANRWRDADCTGVCLTDVTGSSGGAISLVDNRTVSGQSMWYPSNDADCLGGYGGGACPDSGTCCADHEGYPCCDQIGRGTSGSGVNNQSSESAYLWDNKTVSLDTVGVGGGYNGYVLEGRDFYKDTDFAEAVTDGLSSGFSPYTYPHPVRGLSGAYACLSGANSEADTGITFWTSGGAAGAGSATAGGNGSMTSKQGAAGSITAP